MKSAIFTTIETFRNADLKHHNGKLNWLKLILFSLMMREIVKNKKKEHYFVLGIELNLNKARIWSL